MEVSGHRLAREAARALGRLAGDDLQLGGLGEVVSVGIAPDDLILGGGGAGVKAAADHERQACLEARRLDRRGVDTEAAHHVVGRDRCLAGELLVAQRVAVHHRQLVADEAPLSLQPRAEVVLAGEERANHRRPLDEEALAIALLHLEAEGRLEEAHRAHHQRGGELPAGVLGRDLRADQPRLRAGHGVEVGLQRTGEDAVAQGGLQPRAANEEAGVVERRVGGGVELLLRVLVPLEVGLGEAGQLELHAVAGEHRGQLLQRRQACLERAELGGALVVLRLLRGGLLLELGETRPHRLQLRRGGRGRGGGASVGKGGLRHPRIGCRGRQWALGRRSLRERRARPEAQGDGDQEVHRGCLQGRAGSTAPGSRQVVCLRIFSTDESTQAFISWSLVVGVPV